MIRCPTCGTMNQDGRKACSNCGSALPQTQIRCPNCGKLNPLGNIFCDQCNARLLGSDDVIPADLPNEPEDVQTSQVKGISLPTRSASEDAAEDDGMPDWLRSLTPDAEIYAEDSEAFSDAPEAEPFEAVEENLTADEYPDWLSNLLDENPKFEDAPLEEAEQEIGDDDLVLDTDDLPSWFTDAVEEAEPDIAYEMGESSDDDMPESELPDWLTTFADKASPEAASSQIEALPNWLLNEVAEDIPADPDATPDELPDWLLETTIEAETVAEAAPEPMTEPEIKIEAGAAPEMDVDVEREVEVEAEAEADEPPSLQYAESELPDWLLPFEESETLEDAEAEVPARAAPVETSPEPFASAPIEPDEVEDETGVLATDMAAAEDLSLPDWLADLDIEETGRDEELESNIFEGAESRLSEAAAEDRPAWLNQILQPDKPEEEEPQNIPAFTTESFDEEAEAPPEEPEPEETPEEIEEASTWLEELELVDPKAAPAGSTTDPDADLARAELPSWLQQLAPGEITIGHPHQDVFETTEDLITADIPDWVEALKPPADQEGRGTIQTRPFLATPAEPEGPLENLRGVLQPLTAIDIPADMQPVAEMPIPEPVTAQAQLWQQLLEQPRMVERAISQETRRATKNPIALRLLVAAVLILGLLGAFWVLPEGMQLSTIPGYSGVRNPASTAPGAAQMIAALDGLQAGDATILAIEYDHAHAAELNEVIAPILAHLKAQGAAVQAVSTLPEGVALGASLLSPQPTEAAEDAASTGASAPGPSAALATRVLYLPGNASGISNFLTHPDTAERRHLLIISSSPERVRWWLEQTALANQHRAVPLKVSVGLSASAAPHLAPYLQTASIEGWIAGLPDALTYRALRAQDNDLTRLNEYGRVQDILMLAHWAAAAFLLMGLLINLIAGKKGTR